MNDLEDEAMRCPYCSEKILADSVFCVHCGSAVMEPERTGSAEAQQMQDNPVMKQPTEGRISTTDPSVPQRTSPGKILLGVVLGAGTAVLLGVLLWLVAAFLAGQGSKTGMGLLGLIALPFVIIGGAVGVFLIRALGERIMQEIPAEHRQTVKAAVGGFLLGLVMIYLVIKVS